MMVLDEKTIAYMVSLVRKDFPDWSDFSDTTFIKEEREYKLQFILEARKLLSKDELKRLMDEKDFEEFINRLEKVATHPKNNLLFRRVPMSGDLGILYDPQMDKAAFGRSVFNLLYGPGDTPERLERYLDYIQGAGLPNRWTFPTFYLFVCNPEEEVFVKPTNVKEISRMLGLDLLSRKPSGKSYRAVRQLYWDLKDALKGYGPKDMVDIQSFVFLCAVNEPKTLKEQSFEELSSEEPSSEELSLEKHISSQEKKLTYADKIFQDREEATFAFRLLETVARRVGIKDAEDKRFAVTLVRYTGGYYLHLNFGGWLIFQFKSPNFKHRVGLALLAENANLVEDEKFNFSQGEEEPDVRFYKLPLKMVTPFSEDLQALFDKSMDYIARRFQNWTATQYRSHNQSLVAEAIFDEDKRNAFIDKYVKDRDPPTYSLDQCSQDTGLTEDLLKRWVEAIDAKGQAIIYGPPGTGKTYLAERLARHLVSGGDGFIELVQFHPAYAYEDFIQGIRPQLTNGRLDYRMTPGRFMDFCRRAEKCNDKCVLLIDEINRADLSRVFGELMYLLEYRDREIHLAGGDLLRIPERVRIIGTMNTADRSIALVDHALRRRFAFLKLGPDYELLTRRLEVQGFAPNGLIQTLRDLNSRIGDHNYEVGITFFLRDDLAIRIEDIWKMEIEPYLEELFFGQAEQMKDFHWDSVKGRILGEG
ncbi:MAG: AAA family ATPase [Methanotrichaceae archaeon]|nr:AAA family ATPase [Methanotrichaceae archaeon]